MATKGTKNKKVADAEASQVLAAVQDLDPGKVIADLGNVQVSIQNTLASVGAQVTQKINQLEQVEKAITLKEQELSELYDIEKEAITLDDLLIKKAEEQEQWDREQQDQARVARETAENRRREWQREQDEHDYKVKVSRQRAIEEHQDLVARNQREEAVRAEELRKQWEARESKLVEQEDEVDSLKEQVANLDARIKQEVSKAQSILANTLKQDYEHSITLMKKDMETEKSLHQVKVDALNNTLSGYRSQIEELQVQLTAARTDAKEVATKALDSASGRQVADALKNERAKDPTR